MAVFYTLISNNQSPLPPFRKVPVFFTIPGEHDFTARNNFWPETRSTFHKGVLDLEYDLKVDIPWISFDQVKVVDKIPMDSRHIGKVDYSSLKA